MLDLWLCLSNKHLPLTTRKTMVRFSNRISSSRAAPNLAGDTRKYSQKKISMNQILFSILLCSSSFWGGSFWTLRNMEATCNIKVENQKENEEMMGRTMENDENDKRKIETIVNKRVQSGK